MNNNHDDEKIHPLHQSKLRYIALFLSCFSTVKY